MKITFFSNFMNHHQLPLSKEIIEIIGNDYKFVATNKIPNERINMGYEDMNKKYDFIVRSYENEKEAYKLAIDSDVVIIGSSPTKYIRKRIKQGKLTLRYSERLLKKGFSIKILLSTFLKRTLFENKNTFLLCASAYSTSDYNLAGSYIDKTYKWGYFPEVKKYNNIKKLIKDKKMNTILWVGRFLDWKHPEVPVKIAKRLKENGYEFTLNMIGIGELFDEINNLIIDNGLKDNVKLLGSMPPEKVREYMEKSKIFLFTSDRGEGWGAVLNEAMNSACSVVASHEIGSVPFLIEDNKNGLIYEDGNNEDIYQKVKYLLDDDNLCKKIGLEAYNTMILLWNPKVAAERLMELIDSLLNDKPFDKYKNGPCSKAKKLKDNWYKSW